MHPTFDEFINHLGASNTRQTQQSYRLSLKMFDAWLQERKINPLKATTALLLHYKEWLAAKTTRTGAMLGTGTQRTKLSVMKSYYSWLAERGHIFADVSAKVSLERVYEPKPRQDHLTPDEARALVEVQSAYVQEFNTGSFRWAIEYRSLAVLAVALGTGRKADAVRRLRLQNLNFDANQFVKIKKYAISVPTWVMAILKTYVEKARPILDWEEGNDWLFTGRRAPQIGKNIIPAIIQDIHKRTFAERADMKTLATKNLTPETLIVSFASELFAGKN